MGERVLCVEVRSRTTRVCEVVYKKNAKPRINSLLSFENPKGSVEDGYIKDILNYSAVMKEMLSKHGTTTSKVVFSIMSGKIANREVMLPVISIKKLPQVIAVEAGEYFPFDLTNYVVSHSVLEKVSNKDEKQLRVLVLAAPVELIRCYHELARVMEFEITGIDYGVNGYFQVLKKEMYRGVNVSVHITDDVSILTVIDNGVMTMQRIISFGVSRLIDNVIEQPVLRKRTREEAINALCKESLLNARFSEQFKDVQVVQVGSESAENMRLELIARERITSDVRFLVSNISRVLDYYNAKNSDKAISTIYITGIGAKFRGLDRLLSNELGYEVKKLESIYYFEFAKDPRIDKTEVTDSISCIGSALAPVGFVLEEELNKQEDRSNKLSMSLIFALSIVLCVTLTAASKYVEISASWDTEELEKKIAAKTWVEQKYQQHTSANDVMKKVEEMYSLTRYSSESMNTLIIELEAKIPSDMTVKSFSYNAGAVAMTMTGTKKISVAKLIMQLREIPGIENIKVPSISQNESDSGLNTVDFTVSYDYLGTNVALGETVAEEDTIQK